MDKPIFKTAKTVLFLLALILSVNSSVGQNIRIKQVWKTEPFLDTPESVYFSEKKQALYVSCIAGNPTEKNGKGYIAKVNTDGTLNTLKWVEGLNAPKGIYKMDGKLFVTDIDEFVIIDIKTQKIEAKLKIEDAIFLNDVACDPTNNCVYISDSKTGIVYKYQNSTTSVYFKNKNVKTVNGLYNTDDILYLGSMDLLALNKKTKKLVKIVENTNQIDGLQGIGEDLFIGTNWSGRIMELKKIAP